jgi:hypothetical protein
MLTIIGKEKLNEREEKALEIAWDNFVSECRVSTGVFNRYPSGRGGRMSHDEITGLCFCAWYFGRLDIIEEILTYLIKNDGVYNNSNDRNELFGSSRFDVFRIVYLLPFIQATLGVALSLRSQLLVSAFLVYRLIKYDKGAGGDLRTLLIRTVFSFRNYSIINLMFFIYGKIQNLREKTPKKLALEYFGIEPYSEFMPSSW